jgi:hypothetical protein
MKAQTNQARSRQLQATWPWLQLSVSERVIRKAETGEPLRRSSVEALARALSNGAIDSATTAGAQVSSN